MSIYNFIMYLVDVSLPVLMILHTHHIVKASNIIDTIKSNKFQFITDLQAINRLKKIRISAGINVIILLVLLTVRVVNNYYLQG